MPNSFYLKLQQENHSIDVNQGKEIMLELKLKDLEQQ